ncbi:MAG: helix-turn-helix transcriptional regulator [Leptolyngbyaceae cyanobacterium]
MAIKLTETDIQEMSLQAQQQGEPIWQSLELGYQSRLPKQLAEMSNYRAFKLRSGLSICILQGQLTQNLQFIRQHQSHFNLIAKFYLSGASQMHTPGALHVAPDYEEIKGRHYLYHLPNQTEIEEWSADELAHVIYVDVDPTYFRTFDLAQTRLSPPLQKLIEGDRTQRFHQPLGRITPTIQQLLQQILHCPHKGLMQQLYLESKALELFAAQFGLWAEVPSTATTFLSAHDLEQLHQAREILSQQAADPPSLSNLARQVGLNDRKLKEGFRQVFGTTAFSYLRDYRLQQAQQLLCNPNLSISSVAATVGYKSPESFCKAFRHKFAVSPKAYQLGHRSQRCG